MDIKRATISALKWTVILEVTAKIFSLAIIVAATRILDPKDLGNYALSMAVLGILNVISLPGLFASIINSSKFHKQKYYDVAWTYEIFITNVTLAVLVVSSSYLAPKFYGNTQIGYILFVLALIPLFRSFQTHYNYLLLIQLDYQRLFFYKIVPKIIQITSGIILIITLKSIWALVVPEVLGVASLTVLSRMRVDEKPKLNFNIQMFRELWSFGKNMYFIKVLNIFQLNMDKLIFGKLFTIIELGYYQIGEKINNIVVNTYLMVFNKAMYPVYSNAKNSNTEASFIPRYIIQCITVFVIPMLAIMALYSNNIIALVFGEKWLPSSTVFSIFSVILIIRLYSNTISLFFRGSGRPGVEVFIKIVYVVSFVVVILATFKNGIESAAFAILLSELISISVLTYLTRQSNNKMIGIDLISGLAFLISQSIVVVLGKTNILSLHSSMILILIISIISVSLNIKKRGILHVFGKYIYAN